MASTKVNYTETDVTTIRDAYAAGTSAADIATMMGRTTRSIIAKLVQLGDYVAPVKTQKTATEEGPTKAQLLAQLQPLVGFDVAGLEGATKASIQGLIDTFSEGNELAAAA